MASRLRAVCIHGHYYQPPREHPWLGVVEPEPTAAPERDWNVRILRECYRPNAGARLLDAHGRIRALIDNYAWTSFNVGPTLLGWLTEQAPALRAALARADAESRSRTGFGNAWAQAYNHPILPLCSTRDVDTQVRWGAAEFAHRFGRAPDGMWLPEMAVDLRTLAALARAGITLTMLSPHQARRVRPLGADDAAWRVVDPDALDVRRLYRCVLPDGGHVDVVFRHPHLSQGLAFGELLRDGALLADRLRAALGDDGDDALVTAATDGETFGHHHRFGEMALAYAIERLRRDGDVVLTNPAAFRAARPPRDEVEIAEDTSWSCAHGVERWRDDCGCRTGGPPEWTQAWRRPLREAIDWLRGALDAVFEREGGAVLRDPWGARDRYVACVVEPERATPFLAAEMAGGASAGAAVAARRALEMARHGLLMQTSCGWFFEDVAGVEATLVIRQAGRALELAGTLGARLEPEFLERLDAARSNLADLGTGADVYRQAVHDRPVTPARIAASATILTQLGEVPVVPGYAVALRDGTAVVTEGGTGAQTEVPVGGEPADPPGCEIDGRRYGVADLFATQREALLRKATTRTLRAVRGARHEALVRLRAVIDPLVGGAQPMPLELAVVLGYEEADALVAAVEGGAESLAALRARVHDLRARGVLLPTQMLARALGRRLERGLGRLPDGADDAVAVLDLAEAAGVVLDLEPAQEIAVSWWNDWRPAPAAVLDTLRDRLGLSDEVGAGP